VNDAGTARKTCLSNAASPHSKRRSRTSPLTLEADSGEAIIQKINARFFQSGNDPAERFSPCAHRPIEIFHPAYGPKRHFRFFRKLSLSPAQKAARRSYVPAAYDDQKAKLTWYRQ
jgi:hypothetical protein